MSLILLLFVAAERLAELLIAQRNERRLRALGAQEVGAGHYRVIVGLHALWLGALFVWAAISPDAFDARWAAVYLVLQGLRAWVMVSLGRYWTTRIITLPGAPLVRRGPYRVLKHPNYVVVALEILVLPLAVGAWPLAVVFTPLNALVLRVRIKAENRALAQREQPAR